MTTALITIEIKDGADLSAVTDVIRVVAAEVSSRLLRGGVEVGDVAAVLIDQSNRVPTGDTA